MKHTFKALSLAAISLTITACSSTNEPMVYNDFQPNKHDSYAKTAMRLAGSNKFVDSESGDDVTRNVTGSTAMKVGQLLMLDFVGAAQSTISQNKIKSEPLSQKAHYIVRVDGISIDQLNNPEIIEIKAEKKLNKLFKHANFSIDNSKKDKQWTVVSLISTEKCQDIKKAIGACVYVYKKGYISSYIKDEESAFVVFQTPSISISLHALSFYKDEDVMLFNPREISGGTLRDNWAVHSGDTAVISGGKVNKFIKGSSLMSAEPIHSIRNIYRREKNGKIEFSEFKIIEARSVEIPIELK